MALSFAEDIIFLHQYFMIMSKLSRYIFKNSKATISSDIFDWKMSGELAILVGNLL